MRSLALPLLLAMAAPNLDERLARWKPVRMPFNASALTAAERALVGKLVEASRFLESIY